MSSSSSSTGCAWCRHRPATIPELALPLAIQLDRLRLADVTLAQPDGAVSVDELTLAAALNRQGIRIGDLRLAAAGARLEAELGLQAAAPHALQGRLTARIDQQLSGDDIGPIEALATLAGTALRPQFDITLQAPAQLQLRGTLQLDRPQPGFDLSASWAAISWPLQGEPLVSTASGALHLRGLVDDYRLDLRTQLQLPDLPATDLALQARGDLQGLMLEPLSLQAQDGRLQADGSVQWVEGIHWQLALLAERLNPGLFQPEWPGEIGGRLAIDGGFGPEGADGLAVRARIDELSGTLRGYPVSARGGVDWRSGRLIAEGLQFASGPNLVTLDGRADQRLDLSFAIRAPDLASLYPGLGGRLEGAGSLTGSVESPAVVGKLNGTALAYQDMRVQELGLDVDWKGGVGRGVLSAMGLAAGGTTLDRVTADLNGSVEAHRLALAVAGPDIEASLGAQGGLREQVWRGALQDLGFDAAGLGEWRLQAPAELVLGADEAKTRRLCLAQQGAELCAVGGWGAIAGLDLAGRLSGLDLARLAQHLPGEAVIEGSLDAEFSVKGQPASPSIVFDLRPGDGRIRLEDAEQPFDLAFRNARVKGRFVDDRGSAELSLELGADGRATGKLSVGPDQGGQRSLAGEIQAEFPDLSLIAGFVPVLDEVQGTLQAAMALGGTLAAPHLTGRLQVANARARVPAAGILLSDIDLVVQGDGVRPLRVKGQVQSGEGRIALDGSVDLAAAGGPALDLAIRGKDFQAAQLPEARVLVSPDLRLAGSGPYRLSGVLRIPRAAIEIKELPSGTVSVSDDEIVVGDEPVARQAPAARNLDAKVRVELGDEVSFKGFGLSTGLVGAVDATVDSRGTLVDGKIELRDGRYRAYGQDLTVERGRIVFAGPPGNPDVDLRALRVSRDGQIKAYLTMSGPLSKPRPRVYSEPVLPEAEALAYLLTGRGLDQAGRQDGVNIAGAALSLGLSKGEPLLQDMSDRLGLDELRIESGADGLADSSLVLGKYLNPDLYLGYSQGLFNPEGAVLLRLRLSDRLEVESRSGNEQSVDLFYRLEHD